MDLLCLAGMSEGETGNPRKNGNLNSDRRGSNRFQEIEIYDANNKLERISEEFSRFY